MTNTAQIVVDPVVWNFLTEDQVETIVLKHSLRWPRDYMWYVENDGLFFVDTSSGTQITIEYVGEASQAA